MFDTIIIKALDALDDINMPDLLNNQTITWPEIIKFLSNNRA
jgi:hypothetical protein